jgi:hypothetical protein
VISLDFADGINASLATAGYLPDIWKVGMLYGTVYDNALTPLDGVTVSGAAASIYYMDADPADGLFTTGATVNTSTSAAASAVFVVPGAPITTYTAEADGYTFDSITLGALPGLALISAFYAD